MTETIPRGPRLLSGPPMPVVTACTPATGAAGRRGHQVGNMVGQREKGPNRTTNVYPETKRVPPALENRWGPILRSNGPS